MKIITLVENTCGHESCIAEHGLSLYIETAKHKMLLDTGQTDAVVKNAEVLGIDLTAVDTVILSHGHYDHSGGILPFSQINRTAQIMMQSKAAEPHYNGERYIGIDQTILDLPNVRLIDGDLQLDDELFLFSGITGRRCYPQGNRKLSRMENGVQVPDDFAHEQCLVITENGKRWLLSGCAHNGILNILDRYKEIFGNEPDYVITGFHMMKKDGEHTEAEKAVIVQTAQELSKMKTVFYSGHCTGIPAFELMKTVMRDKLRALHSGEEVFFGDEPKTYTFSAPICVDSESGGAYVVFPFDIRKEFGKGRVKVHALFDGIPYDGSIVNMGVKDENGNICYVIGVLKSIRTQLGKSPGDTVEVQIRERR